jgi:hypothetical protein
LAVVDLPDPAGPSMAMIFPTNEANFIGTVMIGRKDNRDPSKRQGRTSDSGRFRS